MSIPFQNIKNIVFDLGGVLLNIDYQLTIDAFENLGFTGFKEVFSQASQNKLSDDFETGHITEQAFYAGLNNIHNHNYEDCIDAWNALLLDFPKNRMELLQNLSKTHRIFLCSNTNETHYKAYKKTMAAFDVDFDALFEKVYYSHLVGLRKPHTPIFNRIIEEYKLKPKETLFIDDSIQHVLGARKAGLWAHHLTGDIVAFFERLKIAL